MPPTFLQRLEAHDRAAEQHARQLQAKQETQRLYEDAWASADPYASGSILDAGLGSQSNDLYHYPASGAHNARPGSRQHGDLPPFYTTEQQHAEIIDAARILEAFCPTACNVLDVLTQFAVFTGFTYQIVEKKQPGEEPELPEPEPGADPDQPAEPVKRKANPLVEKVQAALDKWMREVDWYAWECELFRRTRRDGEAFLILEEDESTEIGVKLRSIEPEQVKEPLDVAARKRELGVGGRASWKYGILTSQEDTATPAGYWVVSQYAEGYRGEFYDWDEVFHLKTEWPDRQAKRGVSDFYSVANDIPGTKKLLRNLRIGGTVQAAMAWIREHPEGMMPSALGDSSGNMRTPSGATRRGVAYEPGTIVDVPQGMKYTAGPMAGTGHQVLIETLQAALRNIGSRWQFPEGLISGDSSNNNLASALVAEGPFCRGMEFRQWHYRNAYKRFLERLIDEAAAAGRLGGATETILDDIEVSVECKAVIARNAAEETTRNAILSGRGILSDQTWASREDLDWDDEQANMAEHPPQSQQMLEMGQASEGEEAESESETVGSA